MSYSFDIVGISPVIQFFNQQQRQETSSQRSTAYVSSYVCTLDSFIEATESLPQGPDWDWNQVVDAMVAFWLNQEHSVRRWKSELESLEGENLIVGRVANFESMRGELESLFEQ
ncbi:hypothetical protein C7271_24385 [filamentous cyanobacterium CCP5]|nr:hypothetical protein C7271_24385 [filamentous cyanobacterium CCP5]